MEGLAPLDQLHIRGKEATLDLARLAELTPGMLVLDVGGGIGGPARTLANEFGCVVTVLDLTEEFCRVGEMLTARTGLSDRVTFRPGNALDMPFPSSSFDRVWVQHSSMNIAAKERLFAEIHRVLRPGGTPGTTRNHGWIGHTDSFPGALGTQRSDKSLIDT